MGYNVRDENSFRGDIAIEYTGLRSGEKLHEELLIGESVTGTEHPKIMRAEEETLDWSVLQGLLSRLEQACQQIDLPRIKVILLEAVAGFEPKAEGSDPLWDIHHDQSSDQADTDPQQLKVTPLFRN